MEITEVRVKLVEKSRERLRAFCSITFDGAFVIRDLKIIGSGAGDSVFVAMPSRKLCDRCPRCRSKNHLRAKFCNECGHSLGDRRTARNSHGRAKIHADVAHPINTECREMIQAAVIKAYHEELERSKLPGYRPPKFDEIDEAFIEDLDATETTESQIGAGSRDEADTGDQAGSLEHDAQKSESVFSDYDSLIADLKKEAASRQGRRQDRHGAYPRPGARIAVGQSGTPRQQRSSADGGNDRRPDHHRNDRRRGAGSAEPAEKPSEPARVSGEPISSQPAEPPLVVPQASAPQPEDQKADDVFGAGLN